MACKRVRWCQLGDAIVTERATLCTLGHARNEGTLQASNLKPSTCCPPQSNASSNAFNTWPDSHPKTTGALLIKCHRLVRHRSSETGRHRTAHSLRILHGTADLQLRSQPCLASVGYTRVHFRPMSTSTGSMERPWMDQLFTGDRKHPELNTPRTNAGFILYLSKTRTWDQEAETFLSFSRVLQHQLSDLRMEDLCELGRQYGFAFNSLLRKQAQHEPTGTLSSSQTNAPTSDTQSGNVAEGSSPAPGRGTESWADGDRSYLFGRVQELIHAAVLRSVLGTAQREFLSSEVEQQRPVTLSHLADREAPRVVCSDALPINEATLNVELLATNLAAWAPPSRPLPISGNSRSHHSPSHPRKSPHVDRMLQVFQSALDKELAHAVQASGTEHGAPYTTQDADTVLRSVLQPGLHDDREWDESRVMCVRSNFRRALWAAGEVAAESAAEVANFTANLRTEPALRCLHATGAKDSDEDIVRLLAAVVGLEGGGYTTRQLREDTLAKVLAKRKQADSEFRLKMFHSRDGDRLAAPRSEQALKQLQETFLDGKMWTKTGDEYPWAGTLRWLKLTSLVELFLLDRQISGADQLAQVKRLEKEHEEAQETLEMAAIKLECFQQAASEHVHYVHLDILKQSALRAQLLSLASQPGDLGVDACAEAIQKVMEGAMKQLTQRPNVQETNAFQLQRNRSQVWLASARLVAVEELAFIVTGDRNWRLRACTNLAVAAMIQDHKVQTDTNVATRTDHAIMASALRGLTHRLKTFDEATQANAVELMERISPEKPELYPLIEDGVINSGWRFWVSRAQPESVHSDDDEDGSPHATSALQQCQSFVAAALREAMLRSSELSHPLHMQWLLEGCVAARLWQDQQLLVELVDRMQDIENVSPNPQGIEHLCRLVQQLNLESGHPFLDTFCKDTKPISI